jgi:[acyl-carrier-protein] S-malonyltransferase
MAKALAEAFPAAAELFARADETLRRPLARVCFEGPLEDLTRTDVAQPAIFTASLAALAALESQGVLQRGEAPLVAGLSLGEYTALCAAGSLSFEDALALVALRGDAMEAASRARPSSMSSIVGLADGEIEAACREASAAGIVSIANRNAPGQVVISGEFDALAAAEKACMARGARRCIRLNVAGAFHSEVMRSAAGRLSEALASAALAPPRVPFLSNVTGGFVSDVEEIRRNLAAQVCAPVLWEECMRAALAAGTKAFVELCPSGALAGLMRKIDPAAAVERCDSPEDVRRLAASPP